MANKVVVVTPMSRVLVIFTILWSSFQCLACAQDEPKPRAETESNQEATIVDGDSMTPAEERCYSLLEQLSDDLAKRRRFELRLTNQVTIKASPTADSDQQVRQAVELTLKADHTASAPRIQLLVNLQGKDPDFVVDWNQGQLTRVFVPEKIYSQVKTKDLRHELRQCQFTDENLAGAHGDFLLRPELVDHVRQQVVHLTDLSEGDGPPRFHLELTDGREVDLWFRSRDGLMLPVKIESHRVVVLQENQQVDVVTTGKFDWDLSAEEIDWMSLAELSELRRVNDLRNEMLGADSHDRVGRAMPSATVLDMSNREVDTATELKATTQPTLLYFWATWAVPSLREMEGVQQFAKELEGTGVRVHPVNVGESQEDVQEFSKANEVTFPVWRDPAGKLCAELGILHLPAVVIVHQGKVATILEEVGPQNREEIRQAIKGLMADQ